MENDLFKNPPQSPFAKGGDVKKDSGQARLWRTSQNDIMAA
jgi:hypothetical protein